ncbi:MAG: ribonuclease E/G, partial [Coriobacteriia bacterium]|nr:ribonuclease E/G [Coriobacteriia bacterium]
GGIIVIDFIDMDDSCHRQEVMRRFSAALERDRTRTRVTELSRLGLVEMTRKNVTDGLYNALTERCSTCGGDGRVLSGTTRRITVERRIRELLTQGRSDAYLLGVNPETYEQLMAPGLNVVASLRALTGRQLAITAEDSCAPTEVKVLIEGRAGG